MSKEQVVKEIHKAARKSFPRRRFIQKGMDDTWQIDLIEMIPYSSLNSAHKYILICIDTFSKFAWAVAMKNKTGCETVRAMSSIFRLAYPRRPKNIQSDDGKEFFNNDFKCLMKKYDINHYSTYSVMKASIVERLIRTLKNWIWQMFSLNGSYRWIQSLSKILEKYNNKIHRTINIAPAEVDKKNEQHLLHTVYDRLKIKAKSRFKAGDYVRISKHKTIFEKSSRANWTCEIFKIAKVQNTFPVTYLLQDSHAHPIKGGFYQEELQRVKNPDVYLVEKILKRSGNKAFVKWLGFPSTENSWIDKKNLL